MSYRVKMKIYIPQFTLTFPVYIFYTQQRKYAAFKQRQRYEKSTRDEVVSLSLVKMVSVVCTMHFIVEYRDVGSGGQGGGKVHISLDFGRSVNPISTGVGDRLLHAPPYFQTFRHP